MSFDEATLNTDADHETTSDASEEEIEERNESSDLSGLTPIRFHLGSKTKSVQQLLERMFESDLKSL